MAYPQVCDLIDRVFPQHLARTQEFLRQPSITNEAVSLKATALWLQSWLESFGGKTQLAGNPDIPIVFSKFDAGRPRTLLVYGMYDVQPVAGQNWSSPPFAAEIHPLPRIGPSIIARGACNSKGPLVGFLNAVEAFQQTGELPVNLILTIEGEEEMGSPTLPQFYRQNAAQLKADAGFEPFWATYGTDVIRPTISLGSKGVISLELICRGGDWGGPAEHAIHSSVGAWLASPTWRLLKALGTLIDPTENITIENFNEEVLPPHLEDEEWLAKLSVTFDEEESLRSMGARRFKYPLHGIDLLRKYLFSPALNVNFISPLAGDTIPMEARAQLVIRTVPGMTADRTVEKLQRHLIAHGYGDIELQVTASYPPSRTNAAEKVVQCLISTYRELGVEP